ncbi:MAG: efflux RND transporter periplasmic adaptor subunit [Aeromicrobium sp.]
MLVLAAFAGGCDDKTDMTAEPAVVPAVTVMPVVLKDVTASLGFTGRVEAVDTVELRARVQGFLEQRTFEEGAHVNKDDTLFVIEKAPFQAAVEAAEGALARAEAEVVRAEKDRERYEELVAKGDVSRQRFDLAVAAELAAKAEMKTAQAQLDRAKLDLAYTDILSPIDGRIGRSSYAVGNLVGPDSGVLATIVSEDPVYVTFPVSQRHVLEYLKRTQGRSPAQEKSGPEAIVVRLRLVDGTVYPSPGRIDFADIQVSQSTDTLTLRAAFPNPDQLLIDGQFVTVNVEKEQQEKALVISQAAVQADQAGAFVLVVNSENKIEVRRIGAGQGGSEGEMVVQSGLAEGDLVVIEGMQKVRPGQVVEATVQETAASEVSLR